MHFRGFICKQKPDDNIGVLKNNSSYCYQPILRIFLPFQGVKVLYISRAIYIYDVFCIPFSTSCSPRRDLQRSCKLKNTARNHGSQLERKLCENFVCWAKESIYILKESSVRAPLLMRAEVHYIPFWKLPPHKQLPRLCAISHYYYMCIYDNTWNDERASPARADLSSESSARVAIRIDRALKIGHPCAHLAWKVPSSAVSEPGPKNRSSVCTGRLSILHLAANWPLAQVERPALLHARARAIIEKDAQLMQV